MFAANTLMRPVTWPAIGSRVVGVAVGSAGGKRMSWARPFKNWLDVADLPVAINMDRGRLVGEPRRSDRVGPWNSSQKVCRRTSRAVGCGTE